MKHSIKLNRAMELYTGFKGAGTYSEVENQLPEKLVNELTGAQLALVMRQSAPHTRKEKLPPVQK